METALLTGRLKLPHMCIYCGQNGQSSGITLTIPSNKGSVKLSDKVFEWKKVHTTMKMLIHPIQKLQETLFYHVVCVLNHQTCLSGLKHMVLKQTKRDT